MSLPTQRLAPHCEDGAAAAAPRNEDSADPSPSAQGAVILGLLIALRPRGASFNRVHSAPDRAARILNTALSDAERGRAGSVLRRAPAHAHCVVNQDSAEPLTCTQKSRRF